MTATWRPTLVKGACTYSWTWERYEIKPVTKGYSARYVVQHAGTILDETPRCLFKCRRIAEHHARTGEVRP